MKRKYYILKDLSVTKIRNSGTTIFLSEIIYIEGNKVSEFTFDDLEWWTDKDTFVTEIEYSSFYRPITRTQADNIIIPLLAKKLLQEN